MTSASGGRGVCASLDTFGGALAGLPADVKARDLRLTPPPIEEMGARADSDHRAILTVRLGADARVGDRLAVDGGDRTVVFHDDGKDGDARAGDREFSLRTDLRFADLAARERAVAADLARRKISRIPVFSHRQIVRVEEIREQIDDLHLHFFPSVLPINAGQALFVTDPSVVGDRTRTGGGCATAANGFSPMGPWSFGYLMTAIANTAQSQVDPADLTLAWLQQFSGGNGAPARPEIAVVINSWPKTPANKLDLAKAPFRLVAIVNRIDLAANPTYGHGGGAEGRFVFQYIDPVACQGELFYAILEYGIPGTDTCVGLTNWAREWLALQANAVTTPAYRAALQALTDQFTAPNADPGALNGSALHQLRTNDGLLSPTSDEVFWELREFHLELAASGGAFLQDATVFQTPDEQYNGNPFVGGPLAAELATWINTNQAAIVGGTDTVPTFYPGMPTQRFLGMASPNNHNPGITTSDYWTAPGILSNEARHYFSLGTCNGCHGREAHRDRAFVQTGSVFLTGETITDPVDPSVSYDFNDLARRGQVLSQLASSRCFIQVRGGVEPSSVPLPPFDFRPTLDTD